MAEISNELLLETLKSVQSRIGMIEDGQRDIKEELVAIRMHQHASQGEINSIYTRLGGIEVRLDRIEKRLDIIDEPAQ